MFETLKAVGEAQLPRAFALLCPVFDQLAARRPEAEVNLLELLVKPGEVACDIGANRGLFIYWLLKRGVRVNAFEPNPRMVRILKLRFPGALKSGSLKLNEVALSDTSGEAVLHIPRGFSPLATIDGNVVSGMGGPVDEVRVPLKRLDDCVAGENVSFIKLDVEGHEGKVLEGALGILGARKPSLIIEAEERHRPGAVAHVVSILEPLGYQGFFQEGGVMKPVSSFDPAIHQAEGAVNADGTRTATAGSYINNFIFAAKPEIVTRIKAWKA